MSTPRIPDEILSPGERNDEGSNEYGREPSNDLVIIAEAQEVTGLFNEYGCDNCGSQYYLPSEPDYCWVCGVEFLNTAPAVPEE